MSKATGAAAVQENAIGHNANSSNKEMLAEYMQKAHKIRQKILKANGELKDLLNEAKDDGFLKTAIRQALREVEMSEEQIQARKEVESERARYVAICKEVGLFVPEEAL